MLTVQGKLIAPTPASFAGHRVNLEFEEKVEIAAIEERDGDAPKPQAVWKAAVRSAVVESDGRFALELPPKDGMRGPLAFTVHAPDGLVLHQESLTLEQVGAPLQREVQPREPLAVERHPDSFRGMRAKLTGRVYEQGTCKVTCQMQVILWAREADAPANQFRAVLVACTDCSGYFSGEYPGGEFAEAFGQVSERPEERIPIALEANAFPTRVLLLLPPRPADAHAGDATAHATGETGGHSHGSDGEHAGCNCGSQPADAIDLVSSPGTYSADVGCGRCVDFTVPNRTLEEFSFYKVIRTTDPEIKGLTIEEPRKLPPLVLNHLLDLSLRATAPALSVASVAAAPARALRLEESAAAGEERSGIATLSASTAGGILNLGGLSRTDVVPSAKEVQDGIKLLKKQGLRVRPEVLRSIASDPDHFTPAHLMTAERHSAFDYLHQVVGVLSRKASGRAALTVENPVDWDETPTFYQATTIAHGHLLNFKQAWRADGYSLGDLLYSLPLAPCQKKQIAIIDWERREASSRTEAETAEEALFASISRDRDIAEIVNTAASESVRGGSSAETSSWAAGGGIGLAIGPLVIGGGGGGGGGSASSQAWQDSARQASGSSLQQLRDQTLQSASAVRSRRATVVQTVRQGETMRVQTEVVANHNHCHAMTVEYFEVLRHFQITQELTDVQECLFVPLLMARFDSPKALRWRESLGRFLRDRRLSGGFDALERIVNNYVGSDLPTGSYAQESLQFVDGELRIALTIARPRDQQQDENIFNYVNTVWPFWASLLGGNPADIYNSYLRDQATRDRVWREQLAPRVAEAFVAALRVFLVDTTGAEHALDVDPTLVSDYREGAPLYVRLNSVGSVPALRREQITGVRIRTTHELPPNSKTIVHSAFVRYRTPHLNHHLVNSGRVMNDLTVGDDVYLSAPLDRVELRNPRQEDQELSRRLLRHLNENLEFYHRVTWMTMDPNRRFMLLDGYLAPNAGGRSVASVVENRLIGIIGNCLVMPVAHGFNLDPTYRRADLGEAELLDVYAPLTPIPPMRVSVPTRGVFAEAVLGSCNSCEPKDETRFWRWEESPCPDEPTPIQSPSTESRRAEPPNLQTQGLPQPIIAMQNAPAAPDPTGLAAAFQVLGNPNLFRDITGLTENQRNALAALQGAFGMAQAFGTQAMTGATNLALQRAMGRDVDKALQTIRQARRDNLINDDQVRSLTERAIGGLVGGGAGTESQNRSLTEQPAVEEAIRRGSASPAGEVSLTRGDQSVRVRNALTPDTGTAGGRSVVLASTSGDSPIPQLRVRRPHSDPQIDWAAYIQAIDGLRNTPDPANPARSIYDSFVQVHVDAFDPVVGAPWRVHTFAMVPGDNFLAWHREYLLRFEEAAGITLPYWDWRQGAAIPPPLDLPNLPAAWGVTRNLAMPGTRFPSAGDMDALVGNTGLDFMDFQRRLELDLHNPVHVWVGGTGPMAGHMSMAISPRDPLFWLLHAMVDHLWEEWQIATNYAKRPRNDTERLQPTPPLDRTVGDTLDMVALGYRYAGLPFRLPAMVLPRTGGTLIA